MHTVYTFSYVPFLYGILYTHATRLSPGDWGCLNMPNLPDLITLFLQLQKKNLFNIPIITFKYK